MFLLYHFDVLNDKMVYFLVSECKCYKLTMLSIFCSINIYNVIFTRNHIVHCVDRILVVSCMHHKCTNNYAYVIIAILQKHSDNSIYLCIKTASTCEEACKMVYESIGM